MSVFFGHIRLDGQSIPSESQRAMAVSLELQGKHLIRSETVIDGFVAKLVSPITAEDDFDQQPLKTQRVTAVGTVRLDNRSELIRRLSLSPNGPFSDIDLLVAAFECWGVNCFEKLLGDWCCAIWNPTERTLTLARDATGISGVLWWSDGRQVIYSSNLPCLLSNPMVPKAPDPLVVGCFLTFFDDPEIEDRTFFKDVHQVAPGSYVTFRLGRVEPYRWWRPEQLTPLPMSSEAECDEAFDALYRDAVHCRLRHRQSSSVGLLLSSGLDSASVLAMAAPELARQGSNLTAYVHRPKSGGGQFGPGICDDESDGAQAIADHVGGTVVVSDPASNLPWLAGVDEATATFGHPSYAAAAFYWVSGLCAVAQQRGNAVMLSGQGGNGTISWTGTGNLWQTASQFGWKFAIDQLRASPLPTGRSIRVQLLSPIKQSLRRNLIRSLPMPNKWLEHTAIQPSFAHSLQLGDRMRAVGEMVNDSAPYSAAKNARLRLHFTNGNVHGLQLMHLGSRFGLEIRDPTRDRRIVEFCWRLPDHLFWGGGRQRMLIRRMLKDKIPNHLVNRPVRGLQSSDMVVEARANASQISDRLAKLAKHSAAGDWVDAQLLQKFTNSAQNFSNLRFYTTLFDKVVPALAIASWTAKVRFTNGVGELNDGSD